MELGSADEKKIEHDVERVIEKKVDHLEFIATMVMSLAAIAVAWCIFQSTKWSGIQAIEFHAASSTRVESTRESDLANSQRLIDLAIFTEWLDAVADEVARGVRPDVSEAGYRPMPGTLAAFYFERMRAPFRPAIHAWLAADPLNDPQAPSSPFVMEVYRLDAEAKARELVESAEEHHQAALQANQNGDNFVLTTVVFSLVIFFGGISSKLDALRNRRLAVGLAALLFVAGVGIVLALPMADPFG